MNSDTPVLTMPEFLDRPDSARIAYHRGEGKAPCVVFLPGFRSDMTGDKATTLEKFCAGRGQGFLRFDYTGHGASSGDFTDGTIGQWSRDAIAAIERLTAGTLVLVGSSMGGWIMLLAALALKPRIAGLIGIAAAPDFTEDGIWAGIGQDQRDALMAAGRIEQPSEYSDQPYVITRRLIEDGRHHLVLRTPMNLPFPVRLLQGTADADVPVAVALRLLGHMDCPDARLTLVKDADHRFSGPRELALIGKTLHGVTQAIAGAAG